LPNVSYSGVPQPEFDAITVLSCRKSTVPGPVKTDCRRPGSLTTVSVSSVTSWPCWTRPDVPRKSALPSNAPSGATWSTCAERSRSPTPPATNAMSKLPPVENDTLHGAPDVFSTRAPATRLTRAETVAWISVPSAGSNAGREAAMSCHGRFVGADAVANVIVWVVVPGPQTWAGRASASSATASADARKER
jgi:hypothetical protein